MMAFRELTKAEIDRVRELIQSGASYPDIYRDIGITSDHLKWPLDRLVITKPPASTAQQSNHDWQRTRIDRRGRTYQAWLAEILGQRPHLLHPVDASAAHLIDLKRAGHSPLRTELAIDSDGLAARFVPEPLATYRSPAAMLAEG
jgi:hypothetical protein